MPPAGALAAGVACGVAMVAISIVARWPQMPLVPGHAAPFAAVGRGHDAGRYGRGAGPARHALAVGLRDRRGCDGTSATSLLFALIHVPIYGSGVIPLDFGVGLIFGGLRLWFGGPAAPAAAHIVADLATWWL